MPKTLTNTEPQRKPKIPDSLSIALKNGGPVVWASCLIMGLANILNGQLIMGLIYLAVEIGVIVFLAVPNGGLYWISMLPSLGWREQQKVFNEKTFVYEYVAGDQSQLILLYGIASLCVVVLLVLVWQSSVRSGEHVPNFKEQLRSLLDENVHMLLMTPPMACLVIFTILPLLYMMSMAFTNYSKEGDHLVLFDWVGLKNFMTIFDSSSVIGKQFGSVLLWTLIWAFFATFLNFFLGTIVALIINRPAIKFKSFWRGCAAVRFPDGRPLDGAARRHREQDAAQCGLDQPAPALSGECDLGPRAGHRRQPVGRHPVYHHAGHGHSAEHPRRPV